MVIGVDISNSARKLVCPHARKIRFQERAARDLTYPHLGLYPEKTTIQTDIVHPTSTAAPHIIAKTQDQQGISGQIKS